MINPLEQNPFFSGGLMLMAAGAAMAMLRRLPAALWGFIVRRLTIAVEVPDRDPAFRWVQSWLAEQKYARRARNLSLTTMWVNPDADPTAGPESEHSSASGRISEARFVLSPAPGTHLLMYCGSLLVLQRARRDLQNGGAMAFHETLTLQMIGGSRALIEELLAEVHRAALPRVPGVNILTERYGDWCVTSWRPKRPLASLVLAYGLLEEIIADMRAFLRAGTWYRTRGVPHRRGYLLHGPPGNGKTTLVAAAAGELGLAVALLSLSNKLTSDDGLRTLVDSLPPATILLLEDVDCAFGAKRKADEANGVTMSGLLNALDGVSSREGRLLFLTTNHPERLDPALVRPGRVDRSFHLGNTTPDQARRIFVWFYTGGELDPDVERWAGEFAARVSGGDLSMAAVQEHLLQFRGDPETASLAIGLGACRDLDQGAGMGPELVVDDPGVAQQDVEGPVGLGRERQVDGALQARREGRDRMRRIGVEDLDRALDEVHEEVLAPVRGG
jgi:chaperone BCS1